MTPRRAALLREMGLAPIWRLRGAETSREASATRPGARAQAEQEAQKDTATPATVENAASVSRHFIQSLGWGEKTSAAVPPPPQVSAAPAHATPTPAMDSARAARIATLDWPQLEAEIRTCRACVLHERRQQAVPGVGDRRARWMFVGEGPGAEEDRLGEPFVGQAGKLLDGMLAAIGLERGQDVYIANAVKCRPPHNRTPAADEMATCHIFLDRQIALVQPRLLIAMGRPAAQTLLGREISIAAARGKRFERDGVALIVTYHPAYLLRNPADKGKAWEDLCFARQLMKNVSG
jgi:DNA polymerase